MLIPISADERQAHVSETEKTLKEFKNNNDTKEGFFFFKCPSFPGTVIFYRLLSWVRDDDSNNTVLVLCYYYVTFAELGL